VSARLAIVVATLMLTGCISEVTTPVARPILLSPPTTLDRGRTGIGAEFAARVSSAQPALDAWSVTMRHGFGDHIEGTLDASYMNDLGALRTPATSSGVTVRAGIRYQAARHVLVFGALAGGTWDKGALMGGDTGLTVGSEYVFFTARLSVNGTLGGSIIDDGENAVFCFLCGVSNDRRNAPHTAAVLETIVGFRLPITMERTLWLALGVELVQSFTAVEYHLGVGVGSGIEVVF
jgi:hypothetical protein